MCRGADIGFFLFAGPAALNPNFAVLPRLQFLTLDDPGIGHREQARLACSGGVRWVQLRAKGLDLPAWEALAREVAAVCRDAGALLVVNDSPAVAAAVGAAGAHLGRADAAPAEARRLLGPRALVGVTLNSPADLGRLAAGSPDYVGVGPFRPTATKPGHAPPLSDESLRALAAAAALPAFAIGGVTADPRDLLRLRGAGLHGVAVSSAIARARDPEEAARRLVAAVDRAWAA